MTFPTTHLRDVSGNARALRTDRRLALALTAILIVNQPFAVMAQDAASPAISGGAQPAGGIQPTGAGAVQTPAQSGDKTALETGDSQWQAEGSQGDADLSGTPDKHDASSVSASVTTGEGASPLTGGSDAHGATEAKPPEPAPSLLEDPAGAIRHMFAASERRSDPPHDLSPWGMFLAADRVVKGVMIGLAFASLATWTVWVAKSIEIACARARAKRALAVIASAANLDAAARTLAGRGGPAAFMVRSAEEELRRSDPALDHAGNDGVKERVSVRLSRIEAQAGRRLTKGAGVLATIGSTSPFVGLFGTVWGIMNSFIGISEAQTTNLAVVAPGIAEALLATAIGLVAAIPAVVIYNVFARSITGYRQLLADAASGVEQLVSLGLDFRKILANADRAAAHGAVAAE